MNINFQTQEIYFELTTINQGRKCHNSYDLHFHWGDCEIILSLFRRHPGDYSLGARFHPVQFCNYTRAGIDYYLHFQLTLNWLYFHFKFKPERIDNLPF